MNDSRRLRLQNLLGETVYDAKERKLGTVRDVVAGKAGDDLRVDALLIGKSAWLTRLGWKESGHGVEVPWADVIQVVPRIIVRPPGE